jgi:predicted TIM-barrel fold metal-dependent hydrolase
VLELADSYAGWWRLAHEMTAGFDAAQCRAIFGANARRVYRLDG